MRPSAIERQDRSDLGVDLMEVGAMVLIVVVGITPTHTARTPRSACSHQPNTQTNGRKTTRTNSHNQRTKKTGSGQIEAINRARQDLDDEWTFTVLIHHLVLRPLDRAYEIWYPNSGHPIPKNFNRHVTAHGVGHPNVFNQYNALIAVMLATSLTRQLCHEVAKYLPSTEAAA